MSPTSARRGSLGGRGAITWVTALLLAALAAAVYLAVVWVPVWFVHYEAKQVVRDYANQAIKNPDDAALLTAMCQKLASLDSIEVPGPDGRPQRKPTVEVGPSDVTWERDAASGRPTLHVAFEYNREIYYPIVERWTERTMRVDITADISRADWGPVR